MKSGVHIEANLLFEKRSASKLAKWQFLEKNEEKGKWK